MLLFLLPFFCMNPLFIKVLFVGLLTIHFSCATNFALLMVVGRIFETKANPPEGLGCSLFRYYGYILDFKSIIRSCPLYDK